MANDIYGNLNILDSALSDSVVEAAESEDGIKNLISSDGGDPSDYYIWERKLVFGEQTKWVAKKRLGAGGVSSIFQNTEDFDINEEDFSEKWMEASSFLKQKQKKKKKKKQPEGSQDNG